MPNEPCFGLMQTGSRIGALFVCALGASALLGWVLDVPVLASGFPGRSTMSVATAICFIFASVAVLQKTRRELGPFGRAALRSCLAVVFLLAAYRLVNAVAGLNDYGFPASPDLGTMALVTAVNFLLFSLALFSDGKGGGRVYSALIAAGLFELVAVPRRICLRR